ncbi:MAG TPA: response regulator transcription factor, partial [Planctomycetaceae bacterium]|nr:response regulator transcription factor [Planctomycetaceae bacterium]
MDPRATVFIVDDDPGARRSLGWLLESHGLKAETYASATAFLEAYDPNKAGCLVLDVRMPGMSGLELQELLTARHIPLPVIFITAYGDVPSCVRAMKGGAVDFIEKPIDDRILLKAIRRAVEEDLQRRRLEEKAPQLKARFDLLTPRETEVMELLFAGRSVKRIASHLGVSFQTAAKHRTRVLEKLQVQNEAELV